LGEAEHLPVQQASLGVRGDLFDPGSIRRGLLTGELAPEEFGRQSRLAGQRARVLQQRTQAAPDREDRDDIPDVIHQNGFGGGIARPDYEDFVDAESDEK
jgi:hypothetical protein